MNYKNEKLDIIVVAGQSNAEGNAISTDKVIETMPDALEMVDANNYWLDLNKQEDDKLVMTLPVQCRVQAMQESFIGENSRYGFWFKFAEQYKKTMDEGRKLMVVLSAVGGTGFIFKQWGVGNKLYTRLTDMVDLALAFNPENRIVALLWHQGENDAVESGDDLKADYDRYHEVFMEQMNDFRSRYSKFQFPIITGEFVNDWADKPENKAKTDNIERCIRDCVDELPMTAMVSSEGLLSNDQEIGGGDDIHFGKKSAKELGLRYFAAYEELVK